ncbi:MAG: transposase [Methylococcales bacterium]
MNKSEIIGLFGKIDKACYKVTNWPEYNNALRKRGDFIEEAIVGWHPAKTGGRGCPQKYSALAIEVSLRIRQVFRLPLRQT